MKDVEVTYEMMEAVALAQLYREDPCNRLKKVVKKMTADELNNIYKAVLKHPQFKEIKEDTLKLEEATLIEDNSDTIMLFYNKLLKDAQAEKKYDVATRILGEIRKLKAIDDAEQKFEVIITIKPPQTESKTSMDTTKKE